MYDLIPFQHRHSPLNLWDAFFDIRTATDFDLGFPIDIREDEKQFTITAELPGVNPKDVSVTLKDDLLTIRGEKKTEHKREENGYWCSERSYGSFSRSVRMPDNIEYNGNIKATYKDGVLTVELPKREIEEPKQIEIAVK